MRLLYSLFLIAILTFVVLIVGMVIASVTDRIHNTVRGTLDNMTSSGNVSLGNISIDKVDVYANMPGVDILNYVLIIAFIIGIVGVFMYSRKR